MNISTVYKSSGNKVELKCKCHQVAPCTGPTLLSYQSMRYAHGAWTAPARSPLCTLIGDTAHESGRAILLMTRESDESY